MLEYLVTQDEMRAYDKYTVEEIGIPAAVLMERAALATADCILQAPAAANGRILCVCGMGNNGGDCLAVARLLSDAGRQAEILLVGEPTKATKETAIQLHILQAYHLKQVESIQKEKYAVIVDGIFGTGLTREISGEYAEILAQMNEADAYKIAIDIPSGIHADSGRILGLAFRADETVTLGFAKRGLYLYPGTKFCGQIKIAEMGITEKSFQAKAPGMYTRRGNEEALLPVRRPEGNKGTFGKLLLLAGSAQMAGAALLAAESAYRSGAGMVKLFIPEMLREIVQTKLPEALIRTYTCEDGLTEAEKQALQKDLEWSDACVIGCGLSVSKSAADLLDAMLDTPKPLVLDADALNLLAAGEVSEERLRARRKQNKMTVLTPHMGELARLLHKELATVTADEVAATTEAAKYYECVVAGKSARTAVCESGKPIFLNTAGNDCMATAGSGDVLAGIMGAFLAGGMVAREAAEAAVYLHALAGDAARDDRARYAIGILAHDITEKIKSV